MTQEDGRRSMHRVGETTVQALAVKGIPNQMETVAG